MYRHGTQGHGLVSSGGLDSVRFMAGLDNISALFQQRGFYEFYNFCPCGVCICCLLDYISFRSKEPKVYTSELSGSVVLQSHEQVAEHR